MSANLTPPGLSNPAARMLIASVLGSIALSLFPGAATVATACSSCTDGGGASGGITLNGTMAALSYDGHGGLSAGASSRLLRDYPEAERNEILDLLFKPGYGANIHQLKVEVRFVCCCCVVRYCVHVYVCMRGCGNYSARMCVCVYNFVRLCFILNAGLCIHSYACVYMSACAVCVCMRVFFDVCAGCIYVHFVVCKYLAMLSRIAS